MLRLILKLNQASPLKFMALFGVLFLFLNGISLNASAANSPTKSPIVYSNGGVIALEPDSNSCVDEACRFGSCSLDKDTMEIARACGADTSGNCVREACNHTGCSVKADLLNTIRACHENHGGDCVQEVCSRVGCNFTSDTKQFALACKKASGGCVKSVCEKTGCTFKSNALAAIESCAQE